VRTFWQDLRYALRILRSNPGFAAVTILTLALGIGANTAIFSVINAVLLRPLPFSNPNQLCIITESIPSVPVVGPSYQNFQDFRDRAKSFSAMSATRITTLTLTGAGEPERLPAQMTSASMFPQLGVQASLRPHLCAGGRSRRRCAGRCAQQWFLAPPFRGRR